MMPTLEAMERQSRITDTGIGTGSVKEEDSQPIMRQLSKQATSRKHEPTQTTEAKLMQLSAMGIQVIDMRTKKP